MEVHLIDGTYELFRHFYALPSARDSEDREVAAVRGVLGSILSMMQADKTYIGVATDHVIESFRNRMWPGYKTGQGVDPELLSQFPLLEETLRALGVVVWAMEEYEADDALASAAFLAQADIRVKRIVISTPDKDLAQCVQGTRVVQLDRRRRLERDEQAVIQKFGVRPSSIPDYLALVGDTADGYAILKDAPFNKRDAHLVPTAGSCADCPKRTGHNKLLFGDDLGKQGDQCKLCGIRATASIFRWLVTAARPA